MDHVIGVTIINSTLGFRSLIHLSFFVLYKLVKLEYLQNYHEMDMLSIPTLISFPDPAPVPFDIVVEN